MLQAAACTVDSRLAATLHRMLLGMQGASQPTTAWHHVESFCCFAAAFFLARLHTLQHLAAVQRAVQQAQGPSIGCVPGVVGGLVFGAR
mmetsp:Transcript_18622/g.47198  ORF Transcript_18622/g.47198 Transcript_18622/m.47198 type:complete len:89 (+) Transcript_18622:2388-2654(+)